MPSPCRRALPLLLILAACGRVDPVGSRYVKSEQVVASQGATIVVSADESEELAGTSLVIPPGALREDTRITLEPGQRTILDGDVDPAGPAAVWGPAGTGFSTPAEMTLPYTLGADETIDDLFVQVVEADGSRFQVSREQLLVDPASGKLRFHITGFTSFQPGKRKKCGQGQPCPSGYVCSSTGRCAPSCTPAVEACDGKDNDCDGVIDEGCSASCGNVTCGPGTYCCDSSCGICGSYGAACPMLACQQCDSSRPCPSGQACVNGVCQNTGCVPQGEVCDGKDNDCDGQIDEGCSVTCGNTVCPSGTYCCNSSCGICAQQGGACTMQYCGDGGTYQCRTNADCSVNEVCSNGTCYPCTSSGCGCVPSSTGEKCGDGVDNDCDGLVDEGCPVSCANGAACPTGYVCVQGVCQQCSAGTSCTYDGGQACLPGPYGEVCGDGKDNDCDGLVDEGCSSTSDAGVAQCRTNADCPSGKLCLNYICQ